MLAQSLGEYTQRVKYEDLSYFEGEEFKAALHQYESALHEGRQVYMDADELTDIAEYYMVKQREDEAYECINMARELHPDAVDPQVFLARQQLFHNKLDKAKRIANRISDQSDREVLFLRQEIMIKEERVEDANRFMHEQLEEMEDDCDHFIFDTASVFSDYNLWNEMMEWAQMLRDKYPDYDRLAPLYCEALINLDRSSEALPLLEKEVDKDAFNTLIWYLLAEANLALQKTEDALEALDYLLAIDENHADGQLLRANCLLLMCQYEDAHRQFLHYYKQNPNDPAALYSDANALLSYQHIDEAIETIERAIQLAKKQGAELYPFRISYSNALSRKGDATRALEQLRLAEEEERQTYSDNLDTHYDYERLRAFIYMDCGEEQKALKLFAKLINESPEDYPRIISIAVYMADHDFLDEARDLLEYVMDHEPDIYAMECSPYLAYCAYFQRDMDALHKYIRQAVELNPNVTQSIFSPMFPGIKVEDYPKQM